MQITKEMEDELNVRIEYNKTHGEYICEECTVRLVGTNEISKHCQEKHHYVYKDVENGNCLGFI